MRLKIKPENSIEWIALLFNLAPKPLIDTQVSFNAARAIMAAADLGIFEALGKTPKTIEQIINTTNTHLLATKNLLNCLVAMNYVIWNKDNYALNKKYYKWLLKEYPSNVIGKLQFQISEWNWMANLENFIKTGKSMNLHAIMSKEEWEKYQNGMRDLSINAAKELALKINIPKNATKMLDIGGSHGMYSIELCKRNELLTSTILELSNAIDRASAIAAQQNLTNRVKYKTGNALTDDLGDQEYDLIMINNVVHHFTLEENKILAHKIAKALKPGGIYAIGEFIRLQKPGEGGVVAATSSLYFALTSSSGTWSLEEMRSWQIEAGLNDVKPISLLSLPGWKVSMAFK